jgi:hypothetical protein
MKITTTLLFLALSASLSLVSCEKKGPAEKMGEKLDEAVKSVEEAVDSKGPAEKIGEAVDKATN